MFILRFHDANGLHPSIPFGIIFACVGDTSGFFSEVRGGIVAVDGILTN
jgi:hypothetical protein